jgi:hypothetical protein
MEPRMHPDERPGLRLWGGTDFSLWCTDFSLWPE